MDEGGGEVWEVEDCGRIVGGLVRRGKGGRMVGKGIDG